MKVLVVGAGVAGGVIAASLRHLGLAEVVVIDRVAADEHLSAGNGLNIGPNCLLALDAFLPEVAGALRAASLPWTRWRAALADGELLYEIPLSDVAATDGLRIRWSELYRIAREALAGEAHFRTALERMRRGGDGRWSVLARNLDDGQEHRIEGIDLVIACDGRYSAIREALLGSHVTRHLGVSNFRLLIEDGGQLAIDDMEEWYQGACRILAFRVRDGRIYVSGNLPIEPGEGVPARFKTAEGLRAAYLPSDGPADPVYRAIVEEACRSTDQLHWARAQEIPTCFHDPGRSVILVGDSSHAMVPTLGQGATQALEDAAVFVETFRRLHPLGPQMLASAYGAVREARVRHARDFSWTASACLLSGANPVVQAAKKTSPAYLGDLRQLYAFDPQETVRMLEAQARGGGDEAFDLQLAAAG